jgi:hypothetical protein
MLINQDELLYSEIEYIESGRTIRGTVVSFVHEAGVIKKVKTMITFKDNTIVVEVPVGSINKIFKKR